MNAGFLLFITAMFFSALQASLPNVKWFQTTTGQAIQETLASLSFFCIFGSFSVLLHAFLVSDLSYLNVALNSHPASELIFKFCGIWASHEGSLLLWLTLVSGWAVLLVFGNNLNPEIRCHALQIIGLVTLCFQLFIVMTANPFVQLQQVPTAGLGLNPLLEDRSLAIHPPLLYIGLSLLVAPYALTCAHLRIKTIDATWASQTRPWALAAWIFLTAGIALGSWWAYYELGWGGWWYWDPVENVSLLPWIISLALLHSLLAVEKKSEQKLFATILSLSGFIMVMLGFALVRSGVLQSVHSFGFDTNRGFFFFLMMIGTLLYPLYLMLHAKWDKESKGALYSRTSFIFLNSFALFMMAFLILVGTIYPYLVATFSHTQLVVDARYFNLVMSPFIILLLGGLILLPFINWVEMPKLDKHTTYLGSFFLLLLLLISTTMPSVTLLNVIILSLSGTMIFSIVLSLYRKRAIIHTLELRYYAIHLAHIAAAFLLIGIILDKEFELEIHRSMQIKQTITFNDFKVTLDDVEQSGGPYFQIEKASLHFQNDAADFVLKPEKRFYVIRDVITTETQFHGMGLADMHAVIGNYQDNDIWMVKFYWHPFVKIIWVSALLFILAGLLVLLPLLVCRKTTSLGYIRKDVLTG